MPALEFRSFHSHRSCENVPNTTRLATLPRGSTHARRLDGRIWGHWTLEVWSVRGGAFCVPAFFAAKVSTIESFAAFFVCLPFLGAMIQWLNGTELTNIFWFSIHFWKGAIRLKRSIPRQNQSLRSTVARGGPADELGADRLKIWRNAADTIQVTSRREVETEPTAKPATGVTGGSYLSWGRTGTAPNVLALKSAVY